MRLEPETLSQLREQAHVLGSGPTALARIWIAERQEGAQREKVES